MTAPLVNLARIREQQLPIMLHQTVQTIVCLPACTSLSCRHRG